VYSYRRQLPLDTATFYLTPYISEHVFHDTDNVDNSDAKFVIRLDISAMPIESFKVKKQLYSKAVE